MSIASNEVRVVAGWAWPDVLGDDPFDGSYGFSNVFPEPVDGDDLPALLVIGSVDMIARRFVEGMASADIDDLLCIKIGGEGDNGEVMIDLLARAILAATNTGGDDGHE